ncbi:MAG: hypothetical protein DI537_34120 [Stutzerimonas stutzeri]|nr:MAG: hypothetical protein DI537_34120 [Stutzerimonas stutzeri]
MATQSNTALTTGQMILADTRSLRADVAALKAAALLLTTPQPDQEVSSLETMMRTLSAILDAIAQLRENVAALNAREAEAKLGRALREVLNDRD